MKRDIESQMDNEDSNLKDYRLRCFHNLQEICKGLFFCICMLLCTLIIYLIASYYITHPLQLLYNEEHITHHYKVRAGYWIDKDRWCSVEDPCIMSCREYDRFDVQCAKDNIECVGGHYDSCSDSPRDESQTMNGWLD